MSLSFPRRATYALLTFALIAAFLPLVFAGALAEEAHAAESAGESTTTHATDLGDALGTLAVETVEAIVEEALQPTLADLDYVYVDSTLVSVDEEQNIVVALADESAVFTAATLIITSPETGAVLTASAAAMVDNTVLFTFAFTDEDATNYELTSITYTLEGASEAYTLELTVEDDDYAYAFDVVSAATAAALTSTSSSSEDVTVITVSDDGALEAADSVEEALAAVVTASTLSALSTDTTSDTHLVIALDPGHGGVDGGSTAYGLVESDLNWAIANYCKTELETYAGVEVYLTRDEDETVSSIETRVLRAVAYGADVIISIHCNAGGATGCEVYVPNDSSYNYALHTAGTELGEDILAQLEALGLKNRGVQERDSTDTNYSDGSVADYYGIVRYARQNGIVGIIIEHAYIDNASDAAFLSSESNLEALGVADATAIAEYFGLVKESESTESDSIDVTYRIHMQTYGWQAWRYDGATAGSTTLSKRLEAIQISIENTDLSGSITYRVHCQTYGWMSWVSDGETAGTTGQSKRVEAIQIELTDELAEAYDVYYRVYVEGEGWLEWVCNGETAGTTGESKRMEAIEIVLVEKGGDAPGSTEETTLVTYIVHCQTYGWLTAVADGDIAGTTGESKRMEAIRISLSSALSSLGSITYRVHCQTYGWLDWVSDGATAGTTGQYKRMEAIQITLTDELAELYDVYYRVHVQTYGWLDWACNGEIAGTTGLSKRLEAIEIVLVEKGGDAPGSTETTYIAG